MKYISLFLLLCLCSLSLLAQKAPEVSASEKAKVIETVAQLLDQHYVFSDKAAQMGQYLKKRHKEKAYSNIKDYSAFADALAKDLQTAHKDLHLRLSYNPQQVKAVRRWESAPQPTAEMLEEQLQLDRKENFGFVRVERLPGNIGYLDFRQFYRVNPESKKTVAAAMSFMANTDAIIVDMRKNGGGDPDMVQLVMSYFTDEKPVHYNSLYNRSTNTTEDFSTLAEVDGKKMPKVDLYVLTSDYTFSAAEEFTYNLKNLKRATIVGETTGGGAHPTRPFVINDHLVIGIPFARAISPFTKTNWEGVGVAPDVQVQATQALEKAQLLALDKLMAKATDAKEKQRMEWHKISLGANLQPAQPDEQAKAAYAGVYEDRVVSLENGVLYYQRKGREKMKMIPLDEKTFGFDQLDYFRVRFARDASGRVEKLIGIYDNGDTDESRRSSE